ncbi:transporter substrate-binding domain-containing protein [Cuspidothrix issatschenkoi]|nr:transporter substrate-binding domain-containing protein [Cuspidothrix issatschenkoi]
MVIVSILFLSYPDFAQTPNNNTNQVVIFGLRTDSPPVSYRDQSSGWNGYCPELLKDLETWMKQKNKDEISIEYRQVSVNKRFSGNGDDGTSLDGECGPNTITNERQDSLEKRDASFSGSFAWTGAKLLLKNIHKASFYQLEPFKGEVIGVYGMTTTTNSLIGSIYTSAQEIIQVDRKDAFEKLDSGNIKAYASDEIILEGMLKDLKNQNPGKSQQYSIVPYSKPLSHEAYGMIIYNKSSKNHSLLGDLNAFLVEKKAKQLRKNNHLDDTQNNFLEKLDELNYYDSGFLIKIVAVSILLAFSILLFLNKLTPAIINGKILDVLNKKVNKLQHSHKQSDKVFLPILLFVEYLFVNYQNEGDTTMSKYNQSKANNQFVDTAESGSNVTFNQNNYTSEQRQNLAKAAEEIQNLLKQLEQTNPRPTEKEQIDHIKDNTTPAFQRRAASALKAGGETAIDEFVLENKYLRVVKAIIKGWIQPDS